MEIKSTTPKSEHESRTKLVRSALYVFRAKGYAATTVEDVCQHAGLTKGSFFHHFKTKEELALASIDYFSNMAEGLFTSAPYQSATDPLERLLGYIDFRMSILGGEIPAYTCLLGTLVQETYDTHPAIRHACDSALNAHVTMLTRDIEMAKEKYAPEATWTAASVGYLIQTVLQGSFIYAKAQQQPDVARESLEHLRCYLKNLFTQPITHLRQENT